MSGIRPYQSTDRAAMFEICMRTADSGEDATGLLPDGELWGLIFAVPYVERHPDLAWVVADDTDRAVGYIVATDDTDSFESWFRDEWWPQFATRFPRPITPQTREDKLVEYAYARAPGREPNTAAYPAHLHIDLLPQAQGQGAGRALTETLFTELTRRGVPGLHLGMNPDNVNAARFYERIGMQQLPTVGDGMAYGVRFIR